MKMGSSNEYYKIILHIIINVVTNLKNGNEKEKRKIVVCVRV